MLLFSSNSLIINSLILFLISSSIESCSLIKISFFSGSILISIILLSHSKSIYQTDGSNNWSSLYIEFNVLLINFPNPNFNYIGILFTERNLIDFIIFIISE